MVGGRLPLAWRVAAFKARRWLHSHLRKPGPPVWLIAPPGTPPGGPGWYPPPPGTTLTWTTHGQAPDVAVKRNGVLLADGYGGAAAWEAPRDDNHG